VWIAGCCTNLGLSENLQCGSSSVAVARLTGSQLRLAVFSCRLGWAKLGNDQLPCG
jgi:hypothetical protein